MAVQARWYWDSRILQVTGCVTEDDCWERDWLVLQYLDEGGKPPSVHVLFDFRALNEAERAVYARDFRRYSEDVFARNYPDRRRISHHYLLGWLLSIHSPGSRHIARMMARIGNIRYQVFDTLEEAVAFLKSVDQTLPRDLH